MGGRAAARVASPWRTAFWEERARPAAVVGLWDLAPLARAVADFLGMWV